MPDLPRFGGGPSQTASGPAISNGISLTANATANTKATSWTELIASLTYDIDWLLITLQPNGSVAYLVDIGIGAATAEVVLIDNLYLDLGPRSFLFPLRVEAGVRLSARCQSSTGSSTMWIAVQAISSPLSAPLGLGRVETIGADTADSTGVTVDPGATANTDAIGQLSAATAFDYQWMCVANGDPSDRAWGGNSSFLVDILQGASGSEVEVIADLLFRGTSVDDRPNPGAVCFPCSIKAGERVAYRVRCSSPTTGDRVLDVVAYGVG